VSRGPLNNDSYHQKKNTIVGSILLMSMVYTVAGCHGRSSIRETIARALCSDGSVRPA
jgi:hypothetical protein